MRYMIKQKFWGWGDNFVIRDAKRNPVYQIRGKVFSWGDKLSLHNMNGQELVSISQKLLALKPTYEIHKAGQPFAKLVKEYTWFRKEFTLDVPGPNDYEIHGQFWLYDYTFKRKRRTVAKVSKKFWSLTDTYGVDIVDGEDDLAILATVIVIDLICHDEDNHD